MDVNLLLINAYLDGELTSHESSLFEAQLKKDTNLAKIFEREKNIREMLKTDRQSIQEGISESQSRVFSRLRDRLDDVPQKKRGIFLPLPVLGAFALAFIAVPVITLSQNGGSQGQSQTQLVQTIDTNPNLREVSYPDYNASVNSSLPTIKNGRGVEVTIQVETLDELLKILEGSNATNRNVKIQLPGSNLLQPVGDPEIIQAVQK